MTTAGPPVDDDLTVRSKDASIPKSYIDKMPKNIQETVISYPNDHEELDADSNSEVSDTGESTDMTVSNTMCSQYYILT